MVVVSQRSLLPGAACAFTLILLSMLGFVPAAIAARHTQKPITTPDGRPVRRVFVHSDDPDAADAAAQIARDTCLITVPDASHADAVLDLGIALPNVDGGGPAGPNIFGNSPHAQTMGDKSKSGFHASASATCDDSKGGGCSNSYSAPAGDLSGMSAPGGPGNSGAKLDVSLASTGTQAQELWEPNPKSKRSWSDQLRVAAGCPVCPGSHFNRRRFPSYRAWIQAECPGVLPSVR